MPLEAQCEELLKAKASRFFCPTKSLDLGVLHLAKCAVSGFWKAPEGGMPCTAVILSCHLGSSRSENGRAIFTRPWETPALCLCALAWEMRFTSSRWQFKISPDLNFKLLDSDGSKTSSYLTQVVKFMLGRATPSCNMNGGSSLMIIPTRHALEPRSKIYLH